MLLERLSYLVCLAPYAIDRVRLGHWPSSQADLFADHVLAALFLGLALLRRRTRRRVECVDALRETLNQAIIHDLKNPMTAIMGAISVVLDEPMDDEGKRKLLVVALHSCRLQMELLETLVDTSRLEFGEIDPRLAQVKTSPLLESCLEELRGLAGHLGVELRGPKEAGTPATFSADPEMIRRVLINLLQNAMKYTPAGGSIELGCSAEKGGVVIDVRDTGRGIPPALIGQLFVKYYRVEGGDQSTYRGSGIGLYYSKLVVEAHKGTIEVDSKELAGTTVRIHLPDAR